MMLELLGAIGGFLLVVAILCLPSYLTECAWNYFVHDMSHGPSIGFWGAYLVLFVLGIIGSTILGMFAGKAE